MKEPLAIEQTGKCFGVSFSVHVGDFGRYGGRGIFAGKATGQMGGTIDYVNWLPKRFKADGLMGVILFIAITLLISVL
ncbi:hypothetical protein QWY22_18835 [Planococcus liqunii]|uniref:Uncharacterized protein n=1 Tax=Planococcus liqunii TaxID=3058394 RepID=A0ABT8MUL0_9BACL|nr:MULTISPECIES: hypothetical protein [unclassified Planococcus (in: firmicutes)]MDN7228415.1 hypothetical protein [Planococcus sp. N064]WKA50921.1 hypothetical protein QWY22_18835 [Planococcus sp. N056]